MKWFGEPWPSEDLRAPVCEDDSLRVSPPASGVLCTLCEEPFAAEAQGVLVPHLTAEGIMLRGYIHIGCLVSNVGGHQAVCELRVEDD